MGCRVHCALNARLQKGKRNEKDNEKTDTGRDASCCRIVSRRLSIRREGGGVMGDRLKVYIETSLAGYVCPAIMTPKTFIENQTLEAEL